MIQQRPDGHQGLAKPVPYSQAIHRSEGVPVHFQKSDLGSENSTVKWPTDFRREYLYTKSRLKSGTPHRWQEAKRELTSAAAGRVWSQKLGHAQPGVARNRHTASLTRLDERE